MIRLRGESTLPWICMGDFNEILRPEEQWGPNERDSSKMAGFREAVDLCGLADIGYKGLDWTFEKRIAGGEFCRVRLDRALASASWSSLFPFASVRHLVSAKSDHSPIILFNDLDAANRRIALDKPFRYEQMWETHDEYISMLEQVWASLGKAETVQDTSLKLHALASALAAWASTLLVRGGVNLEA